MNLVKRRIKSASRIVILLLLIEWLDEFVFGAYGVSVPLIRDELNLSYEQIGLLLTLPAILSAFVFDPFISIYGDTPRRRLIMLLGGVGFVLACLGNGLSVTFVGFLAANILFQPSSGGLVGLAQPTLMDLEPTRHEQNMARWTLAGSVGVVTGSLAIAGLLALGINWRIFFIVTAIIAAVLVFYLWRTPFPIMPYDNESDDEPLWTRLKTALGNLRDLNVVRWFLLLEASDLMLDILFSFLTLYFVDVVGVSLEQAAFGVAVWTTVGLIGDAALVPILERIPGVRYLRWTIPVQAVVYTAFLLVPSFEIKVVLAGINGFLNAGWYAILQANVYTALPNQSASVLLLGNIFSLLHLSAPFVIGLLAERYGLGPTMVFPLVACVIIWFGLPWGKPIEGETLTLDYDD